MDILNWVYLLKNKLVKTTVQNPEKDLLVLGNNVSWAKRGDKYQSYGMTVQDFAAYVNESLAGNCPIQMNFKPGSIGEMVSFAKASGSDPNTIKDVIIPGLLEITRNPNGNGIYNIAQEIGYDQDVSPLYTSWNTQYIDDADTTWAPLWDVQNRTYTDWRGAVNQPTGGYAPPMYVGTPAVMKYDFDGVVRYWLILFTEWGVGNNNEYGFAYDRWEILPEVSFEKLSTGNQNLPFPADIISEGVHITRGNNGGLYNPLFDNGDISNVSPTNTKWNSSFTDTRTDYSGYTNLNNLESRIYSSFENALDGAIGNNIFDTDLIMYDMTTDLYYKVVFDNWGQGCNNEGYNQGEVTGYSVLTTGLGYNLPNGTYNTNPSGGTGFDLSFSITVLDGAVTVTGISTGGESYTYGDIVTLNSNTATQLLTIQLEVCEQGGFAYTRTVIPQSCGVKFADGTIMNTAVTASAGATGTAMNYQAGLLSPQVQSDFIQLPNTITDDNSDLFNTYKLGGIANFSAPGTSAYSYLIGVISGDSKLALINDASVIGANVNTYDQVSGKFAVNAYVRDQASGNIIPLTFATIVLDNTIASPNDYFVSIVATAGASWQGAAYIDIEFMSDQVLAYYN